MEQITVGVLTISDRCSKHEAQDTSGPHLVELIQDGIIIKVDAVVKETALVPDEVKDIQKILKYWCDNLKLDVVLTTGGTGLSVRDVTPEATTPLLDKVVPGIPQLIFKYSSDITPFAALSRGTCGVRGKSLIVNFPGSKKASEECLRAIADLIPHAKNLICGEEKHVASCHTGKIDDLETSRVNPDNIVNRPRKSLYRLFSVQEAQACVLSQSKEQQVRDISLSAALGYVLAEDIQSKIELPPFPASIKDGYAVVAEDKLSFLKKCCGTSSAGDCSRPCKVLPGYCARVNTGAPIPPGADAVIQVEDTVLEKSVGEDTELEIRLLKFATKGQDIRAKGSDVRIGETVLQKGENLGPCELGVLATVGVTSFKVFAKPKVGVLSTGNELQNPNEKLHPGKINDSNRTTLINLLNEQGYKATDLGIARDHPNDLFTVLKKSLDLVDVVITTGSVSMGEKDYLKQVLVTDFKADIHFGRVEMKPGKPTSFATFEWKKKKAFWFGLPGNPVSAAVTCHLFVLPLLKSLSGQKSVYPTRFKVKIDEEFKLDERPEYRRAILSFSDESGTLLDIPVASTTGNQISSRLLSCVGANCLLELPPNSHEKQRITRGSIVNAILIQKLN